MASSFWIAFTFEETLSHSLPLFSVSIMFVAICFSSGTSAYWDEYLPAGDWPTYVMSLITILSLLVLAKSSIYRLFVDCEWRSCVSEGSTVMLGTFFLLLIVLIFMVTQAVVLLWFLLISYTCCAYLFIFYAYCWSRWEGRTLYSCQASLLLRGWAVVCDNIYLYPWAWFISHLLGSRCISSWFLCQQGDLWLVHSLNIPRYFVPPVCRTDSTTNED